MTGTMCKDLFTDNFLNWDKYKKTFSKDRRSFQFDETTDTIHSYVLSLKQCVQMLGYNKGQVLGLSKKTLSTRYEYLLFGIQNFI